MITTVESATVHVSDQDAALDFYTGTLGFRTERDAPMEGGMRWLAVTPPGGGAALILAKGFGSWAPEKVGAFTGLVLNVEDMAATCAQLREAGVRFDLEPEQQPWGMQAVIADPDGNTFVLRSFEGAEL